MRTTNLLQIIALSMCLVVGVASSQAKFKVNGVVYDYIDPDSEDDDAEPTTVEVVAPSSTMSAYSGDIVIPETISYSSSRYENSTFTVVGIDTKAFDGATEVTSVSIPSTVTYLGAYSFRGCTGLTSITIPQGVATTGSYVFQNCTSLTSVTIECDGYSDLGSYIFDACTGITTIYCTSPSPSTSVAKTFRNTSVPDDAILYIPAGSASIYADSTPWGSFVNIVEVAYDLSSSDYTQVVADGITYNIVSTTDFTAEVGPSSDDAYTGDVSIPSTFTTDGDTYTVVGVGDTAFKDCAEITSVTLPATITYIGDSLAST